MELEARNFWLLRVFFSALADVANEVEIVLLGFPLCDAEASTVLPDAALITCDAMCTIILLDVSFTGFVRRDGDQSVQD